MVIKLGIIGLSADPSAWATIAHVEPLKQKPLSEQYKLAAVATSSPETAKAAGLSQALPGSKTYSSAEDIANDEDVHMIVVSVKAPLHYQLTMPALKAKKDVFVEWPLGATTTEAEELAAFAKKQGVKTVVGLQARLAPIMLKHVDKPGKAREIIDSGALGRILSTSLVATMSMFHNFSEKNSYVNDPNAGVNLVSVPVMHTLDPLCFLLGEFKWLSAATSTRSPEIQFIKPDGTLSSPVKRNFADAMSVQGVLDSGTFVSFSYTATTTGTPDHLTWIIGGEKASLKIEGNNAAIQLGSTKLSFYEPPAAQNKGAYDELKPASWKDIDVPPVIAFGGIGEVYQAFAEGKPGLVDFEEAVKRHRMYPSASAILPILRSITLIPSWPPSSLVPDQASVQSNQDDPTNWRRQRQCQHQDPQCPGHSAMNDEGGSTPPPERDRNLGPVLIGVNWAVFGPSWIFVILRLITRIWISHNFGWDDAVMVLAQVRSTSDVTTKGVDALADTMAHGK
ncbi:MAG: hypothetical protein Q9217_002597 [Psora testacea]